MGQNALAALTMANLAAIARGENVSGISDDGIGAMFDDDDDDVEGLSDDDDVEGLSDDDVGAVRRGRRRRPRWHGRKLLPVEETAIAAGATATIQARPNHTFKAQRLILEPTNIDDFAIQNIVIRGRSQFEATGTVPGSTFAPDAADANFVFDVCPSNSTIDLQVTNNSAGALTFRATLLGLYR